VDGWVERKLVESCLLGKVYVIFVVDTVQTTRKKDDIHKYRKTFKNILCITFR